jgi:hypothetical protein
VPLKTYSPIVWQFKQNGHASPFPFHIADMTWRIDLFLTIHTCTGVSLLRNDTKFQQEIKEMACWCLVPFNFPCPGEKSFTAASVQYVSDQICPVSTRICLSSIESSRIPSMHASLMPYFENKIQLAIGHTAPDMQVHRSPDCIISTPFSFCLGSTNFEIVFYILHQDLVHVVVSYYHLHVEQACPGATLMHVYTPY